MPVMGQCEVSLRCSVFKMRFWIFNVDLIFFYGDINRVVHTVGNTTVAMAIMTQIEHRVVTIRAVESVRKTSDSSIFKSPAPTPTPQFLTLRLLNF
jgi:hypothetical protein